MDRRFSLVVVGLVAIAALVVMARRGPTGSTPYPDRTREVRHVIPWRAGGSTDGAMRGFMSHFEQHLGVRVVTENVPGGLSSVGLTAVQNARADGYTLGTMTYDALTVEILDLAPLSWRSFEPICMVTDHPSALIVPGDGWPDLEAFRDAAARAPGSVTVGNVGMRGIWHQHAAAMEEALEISVRHIPYEGGSGPQLAAILGGEVDAIVSSLPAAIPYVESGSLRVLAVMAADRNELVPDVPTFRELGYEVEYGGFRIVVAPGGTPSDVLETLEGACAATARDPAYQEWAAGAAIGASWKDRAGTVAYLDALSPKVEALMARLDER
ncbi:MAG: tripartite tricarboxylate transporter substrate binding protein [Gemmatimonadota bacterium]